MRSFLLCCLLLLMGFAPDSDSAAGPRPQGGPFALRWKKIDQLLAKDQVATAAPLIAAIYQQARQAQNTPDYVRALLYQVRLLAAREEDADEKGIALLEKDLRTAAFPARPILHSLLAELYTNYLNQNRYRLYQRTAGAGSGNSLATWDVGRLGAAIVRHYYQSVEDEPQKQLNTTLAQLGDLAVDGDAEGRALRPTLYDLLAQRAIAGLQNQELYVTRPEQQFQLTEPRLFGSAPEFAALRLLPPAADSLNGQVHALHLLQRLTAARLVLAPQNLAALADVDLQRLDYLRGLTENTDLAGLYGPALVRMAETYRTLPMSTGFLTRRAELLRDSTPVAAVEQARQAEARFPKSRGAVRARALRAEIQRPELTFLAAEVIVPNQPWRLELTTRNVTQLHAWAYRVSLKEWIALKASTYGDRDEFGQASARLLKTAPATSWAVPVPAHPIDYKAQKLAVAGAPLQPGYYLIVVSNTPQPPRSLQAESAGTATGYALLGASGLSAVQRQNPAIGAPQVLVLHRQTGAPLAGVQAQASYYHYDQKKQNQVARLGEARSTDAAGQVELPAPAKTAAGRNNERVTDLRIWRGRDTLLIGNGSYYGAYYDANEFEQPRLRTFLFTDRAIYRPGQTLYFKGILTQSRRGKASVLAAQPLSVRLVDVNGQTVLTLPFTTSDFGSFNGSLILPTGLLNGEMSLQTDNGSLRFAVEDYKRPTFQVKLDSVPGRPQPGQPLTVAGRARAYAGQATDGAKVNYRVTRRALWLLFAHNYGRSGYPGRPSGEAQEIVHGTTRTDAEGRFTIVFTPPLPAQKPVRGGWEPGYVFEITADVTDAAGETRTGTRSIVIGRNPLSIDIAGPSKVDKRRPGNFTLLSQNATGEPLPATGTLRLLARQSRLATPGVPAPRPIDDADSVPDGPEPAPVLIKTLPFDTKNGLALNLSVALADLPPGRYRLEARTAPPDTARDQLNFVLFDSEVNTLPYDTPNWFVAHGDTTNPNLSYILLGSRDAGARILLETERGGQLLRREWLTLKANEQRRIPLDTGTVSAAGPLYVHTTQVRDNQLYQNEAQFETTPRTQPLKIAISTFRNRLLPGEKETWRLTIRQADGKPADAELLATLYDQSLDIFRSNSFMPLEADLGNYPPRFGWRGNFTIPESEGVAQYTDSESLFVITYPQLNTWNLSLGQLRRGRGIMIRGMSTMTVKAKANSQQLNEVVATDAGGSNAGPTASSAAQGAPVSARPADLSLIPTRSDFRETAFWQPALRTDKNGDLVLEFQMPEAVTRWQLLALAHDKSLHSGQLARQLVTQKQIQITPNAPRFFRQGDSFTFQAKFSNLTAQPTAGTAQLILLDAATGLDLTNRLLTGPAQQPVSAAAHQSAPVSWEISLPADFTPTAITYKVVATTSQDIGPTPANVEYRVVEQLPGKKVKTRRITEKERRKHSVLTYSDGEQNTLPVLPNRLLITESLPLSLVGPGTRTFELTKLTSTSSLTRRNYALTLELTPKPAWLAVQSLPYLTEYPYEGSEQTFSRLYANLIAAHILKANPRLKTVLAEWQRQAQSGTAAQKNTLSSKLEQNQDLKNLLLQETPWVRDAQNENERLARLTTLFDQPRLDAETTRALARLAQMQLSGGAFPWFEKMPDDRYLTQLLVAGFGKLHRLGVFDASQNEVARGILQNAVHYLDQQLAQDYAGLRRAKAFKPADNHLSDLAIQALYARSFWPKIAIEKAARPAYAFFHQQAAVHWPGQVRQLQAQLALALFRADNSSVAAASILRALRENALHAPELGMYWKEAHGGYYWREAPTETQAVLIEAFDEVAHDQKAVDEMKIWLLRQKQVQSWPSTRATADACYALLLRGSDLLAPTAPLQVLVGVEKPAFDGPLAGTGYLKTTWPAADIKPVQGQVTLTKTDPGVAWGALYWQYFEDLDKVTPAATALAVERQLYRETRTAGGPVLAPITAAAPLKVGDVLVVRLVLRTDRALEYVHLKDQRAAGLELSAPTSGYQYQNGLSYYESPRDAATNFFFSELPKGTHVFEYRLRAAQAGDFSGGLSQVQCLYAPEFGAVSAGGRLRVGP